MDAIVPSYKGFRFPVEIISHCVWLYHRFPGCSTGDLAFIEGCQARPHGPGAARWLRLASNSATMARVCRNSRPKGSFQS
jgi:hypothetical protein